ncbi:MAG: D-aminoacylase [bacterium]|nr:D-aminoacylase [bacterium]
MAILIKNATIIDGTAAERKKADILIEDNRIKKIGELGKKADKVIDAGGLFAAPGFIDVNNDSDHYLTLWRDPNQESFLYQGVTTAIGGNCGASLAPLVKGDIINSVSKWTDVSDININWQTVSEFFDNLERRGLGLNFGTLAGHTTMRRGILKDDVRELTPDEILKMRFLLDSALAEGALGMSVGLAYSHAKITPKEELDDLARIVKDHDAVFAVHLRGEGEEILPAVKEAIDIAQESKVRLEISHFKISGKENWPDLTAAFKMIDEARAKGLDINFDVYPYIQSASVLYIVFPDWVTRGGRKITLENLKDDIVRKKVIEELKEKRQEISGLKIAASRHNIYVGKTIKEIAKNQGVEPEEAAVNLYLVNDGRVIVFWSNISEENLQKEIGHPASFIGSNGAGYNLDKKTFKELIHPRCFGAFPRFLDYAVKEKRILNWEEAINKITGGPAKKFSLTNRGLLKENYFADIVIFDPEKIGEKATFENPFRYAEGVEYLLINGAEVVEKGKYSGKMAGRILKRVSGI